MLRVLASRVDTLEASFRGELKPGLAEGLEQAKLQAQADNLPQPLVVGDTELMVQPKGLAPWSYVLTSEDLHLRASAAANVPCASVKLTAFGLAYRGHEALWAEAQTLAQALGATEATISRLDLAVDFQGHVPTLEEMDNTTCPSNWRVVYPNREHPETFVFGKGGVVVRIYNKSVQIRKEHKEWAEELWAKHPDYRPGEDVWRFEVQYRREALRSMGSVSVEDAFGWLPGYLFRGLLWVSPRERTERNLSRCEIRPWWQELRGLFASEPVPSVKEKKRASGFAQLTPQMLGLLVSASANAGVYNLSEAVRLQAETFRSYIANGDKSFERRVRERQRIFAR